MSKTYISAYPYPGIKLHTQSMMDLGIETQDRDARGYILRDGTNRSLYAAIDEGGVLRLVIEGPGEYEILSPEADMDYAAAWLECMGDYSGEPSLSPRRIRQGIERARQAIAKMRDTYTRRESQETLTDLDELIAQVEQAISEYSDAEMVHPEWVR